MFRRTNTVYHQTVILSFCFLCLSLTSFCADWDSVLAGTDDISSIVNTLPENEIDLLEKSVKECTDQECIVQAQLKLGSLLVALRRPDEAIEILTQTIELSDDVTSTTFAQLTLGRALVHTREIVESEKHLKLALQSANNNNLYMWAGDAAIALSVINRWQMNLDMALSYREDAYVAYKNAGYLKGQARSLHYTATIHALKGNLIKAMQMLQQAVDVAREANEKDELAGCLGDLANLNHLVGNNEVAIGYYQEATECASSVWRKGLIEINIGSIQLSSKNYEQALEQFLSALEAMRASEDKHNEAITLQGIGFTLTEMGKTAEGIEYLDLAIELAEKSALPMSESYARHFKGSALLEINQLELAKQELQTAFNMAEEIDYFDLLESCLLGLAKVERKSGNNTEALSLLEKAVTVVSDVRQNNSESSSIASGYFSTTGRTFSEMIDLLWELHTNSPATGYGIQAFNVAQKAKARSLLDMLTEAEIDVPEPVFLDEVQNSVLQTGELLLEYHLGEESAFVWVVSNSKSEFRKIVDDNSIEKSVRQFLPMLSDFNVLGNEPAWFNAAGKKLTNLLLGDFIPEITSSQQVIISADGILHYLPFEVLPLSAGKRFQDIDYLILSTEITYTPSISALSLLRKAEPVTSDIKSLLVGDPILSDSSALFSGLSPLQNAAAELSSINLSLGSNNEIVTQENATKENLLSLTNKSYRFAHFATHGVFNEESPQYSGLILSPDENQNNFLSVSDIFAMNLPCEMVTLSACSSALGDNVSGEGIVGLTRGFMYAGARSVCSTLWDVSGESTAEFMTDFYKLLANDIDKGTALAKTKREMIASDELAHPFFWGAFVLSGEN